ncbi:hypothetical protein BGZ46_006326 [Entomortierella lignicola]|nr:hypothetical protein BGZ46_006326 [Entomortierella lignicola]
MSSFVNTARTYLFGGPDELAALSTLVSPLEKRSLVHFAKRRDQCSTYYYCPDGFHCISTNLCRKNANYAWTAVFGVLLVLCLIAVCIRRRRSQQAYASQPEVVTTQVYPQQTFAPPPGDPNMAYSQPSTYPPINYPATTPAPAYTPEAPPATYSPYPAPGTPPYSAHAPQAYAAPDIYPPTSGHYPPPASVPYAAPTSAPYPAPQGEAASYAPPR